MIAVYPRGGRSTRIGAGEQCHRGARVPGVEPPTSSAAVASRPWACSSPGSAVVTSVISWSASKPSTRLLQSASPSNTVGGADPPLQANRR